MVRDGDLVGAAILIAKFDFHADFDINDMIVRLIEDLDRLAVAKSLVKKNPESQKNFVNILLSMKNVKGAVKAVKEFDLDPSELPQVVEAPCLNAVNYFVSQTFRAQNHPDHIPLSKVEDLLFGDPLLISCLLLLLLKRWKKIHKGNLNEPFLHKILGIIKRSNFKASDPHVSPELKELMAQI